jgi:hypothetical protein
MISALLPPQLDWEEADKLLAEMPENIRREVHILETSIDLHQAWEKWEKVQSHLCMKKYLLAKRDDSIYLVNTDKVAQIMRENYPFFRQLLGTDFCPEDSVLELKNPDSVFWEKLLQNHTAMGMLYGFGKDNAELFQKNMSLPLEPEFSTDDRVEVFKADSNNFSIPIFVSQRKHPLVQLYEREKKEISRIYKDKDMLSVKF